MKLLTLTMVEKFVVCWYFGCGTFWEGTNKCYLVFSWIVVPKCLWIRWFSLLLPWLAIPNSNFQCGEWRVFAVSGQYDQQFFCQWRCCYCRRCCCCYQCSSDISLNHFLLLVMLRRSNLTLKYTTDAYAHFSE